MKLDPIWYNKREVESLCNGAFFFGWLGGASMVTGLALLMAHWGIL